VPLLLLSAVVVLVSFGLARGLWLPNLHNGLLALGFAGVGAYVLFQRQGHREGRLLLATGVVEAVLFLGRQIGHAPGVAGSRWWGWLGVWPTVLALALATLAVLAFPDGRLPSPRWRWTAGVVVLMTTLCAALSALWPVEYDAAGLVTPHPLSARAPELAAGLWSAVAHPTYIAFQVLWIVAIAARWRSAGIHVRRQLTWLVSAALLSLVALVAGLLTTGTPRAGLLTATLVPVAAGWAIVHGQHLVAYSALSWLSRSRSGSVDLASDLSRTVAEALNAPGALLWMGDEQALHAVGVWPGSDRDIPPTSLAELSQQWPAHTRVVERHGLTVGALTVQRAATEPLTFAESRLLDDLAAQAALVIDHMGLADVIARQQRAGNLEGLSARERDVLELMARGRSNAAICDELHLSIKTVEPIVSTIFNKLDLHVDAADNRRVLAVLAYLRG
jgi:DNA-binding CsgD family transcriptional regulator